MELRKPKPAGAVKRCEVQQERLLQVGQHKRAGENVGLLLNGAGDLVTKDVVKGSMLSAFLATVFTDMTFSSPPEIRAKVWS